MCFLHCLSKNIMSLSSWNMPFHFIVSHESPSSSVPDSTLLFCCHTLCWGAEDGTPGLSWLRGLRNCFVVRVTLTSRCSFSHSIHQSRVTLSTHLPLLPEAWMLSFHPFNPSPKRISVCQHCQLPPHATVLHSTPQRIISKPLSVLWVTYVLQTHSVAVSQTFAVPLKILYCHGLNV